jgi:LysM domain
LPGRRGRLARQCAGSTIASNPALGREMARVLTEASEVEPRNITARVLAPLALIACGLALFVLISDTVTDEGGGRDGPPDRKRERVEQTREQPAIEGETYVVVAGDTFSGIAAKAGISEAKLERLNPDVDPATLNPGQTIKLRR